VTKPVLVAIDTSKAPSAAARAVFDHSGTACCQLHKIRLVGVPSRPTLPGPEGLCAFSCLYERPCGPERFGPVGAGDWYS
jgi:hypothetical protein